MERVVIAGCPGAGKSTAARRLSAITGLPVIHLDHHFWRPGWTPPPKDVWHTQLEELVARPRWIMDGNYGSTMALRLAVADTLIHLDFSTGVCFTRALRRTLRGLGQTRDGELPEGCPDRLDWPFFKFILTYRRKGRLRELDVMSRFAGATHRFERPRQLDAFLSGLDTA